MGIVYDIRNDLRKSHNKEEQSDLSFAPTKKQEERRVRQEVRRKWAGNI